MKIRKAYKIYGHKDNASRISQSGLKCVKCGYEEHADVNAAKVIKKRGGIEFFQNSAL